MLLTDVYGLVAAKNVRELHAVFMHHDRGLMALKKWDSEDPTLMTNQIKNALIRVDLNRLSEYEREWCQVILYWWYHHAISSAIWRQKDKMVARTYASQALEYQPDDDPNQITLLLYLLVHDKPIQAEKWAEQIVNEPEKTTARELIEEYKAGKFF